MKKNPMGSQVPWITEDGFFDPTRFPIDSTLNQALSPNISEFESACRMLGLMESHGRTEAGVYLVGLFHRFREDRERLIPIVENFPKDPQSAELLVAELYRVKSTNTTRGYLNTVIKTLARYPRELVERHFERLCEDKFFSPRLREKFKGILATITSDSRGNWGW